MKSQYNNDLAAVFGGETKNGHQGLRPGGRLIIPLPVGVCEHSVRRRYRSPL